MKTKTTADTAPAIGQHTPGEWYYAKLAQPENHRLTRIDYEVRPPDSHCSIAYLVVGQDASARDQRANPKEVEANARLIAAAPKMLKALESVLASVPFLSYRGDGELEECEQDVRSAIAQAKGQA